MESPGQVKETARQEAGQVTSTAAEQAGTVASQAMEQVGQVTGEARAQVQQLASQAADEARSQADAQTEKLAEGLRTVASQLQALVDGNPAEAGPLPDYARQLTGQLQSVASHLGEGGVQGVVDDVQRFARRKPGLFLVGAAAAGFLGGRLVRGAKAAADVPAPAPAPTPAPAPAPVVPAAAPTAVIDLDAPPVLPEAAPAYADGVR